MIGSPATPDAAPLLRMRGICKSFPGVRALHEVALDLHAGEVLALLGENGAGKSTLIKILGGAHVPDAGTIEIDGEPVRIPSPTAARQRGISIIYQEFNLVPALTARENLFLGQEKGRFGIIPAREERQRARELFNRLGVRVDPERLCRDLTVAQQQIVEIAKALAHESRMIVMDEPTAPLSPQEVAGLFAIIRELKSQGIGVIYISHRLNEIFEIADRVTVLRDGEHVGTLPVAEVSRSRLIEMMVGRRGAGGRGEEGRRGRGDGGTGGLSSQGQRHSALSPHPSSLGPQPSPLATPTVADELDFPKRDVEIGEERLVVSGLTRGDVVRDVSFSVRRGEIVGLTGLVGAGRTETARLIFGIDRPDRGTIQVDGRRVTIRHPRQAIAAGICLLPEDRKSQGLVLKRSVLENFGLPNMAKFTRWGVLDRRAERGALERYIDTLRIRLASLHQPAAHLSGGNQQKVVLAKWLMANAEIVLFDEPTRGIDVGAKYEIYLLMNELARRGKAVLMISSELPEVLGMADRILVMCEGRISGEITDVSQATQQQVLDLAVH
jgi:ribose transport system ATP-binding protein